MSLTINVEGGAARDGDHLCKHCTYATLTDGRRSSESLTYCNSIFKFVSFQVAKCSSFLPHGSRGLNDMKQEAWILEVKGTRIIGFHPPEEDS